VGVCSQKNLLYVLTFSGGDISRFLQTPGSYCPSGSQHYREFDLVAG